MKLLEVKEVAEMLGLSVRHVSERLSKHPDFPRPVFYVSRRTKRWSLRDIQKWVAREYH